MKKKLIIGILTLSLLLTAAGCAGQPSDAGSSLPSAPSGEASSAGEPSSEPGSSSEGASSGEEAPAQNLEGTLEEIMASVYAGVDSETLPKVMNTEITAETESYYLGTEGLGFTEALASDAMINAVAHSVCLIRMPEGTDMEAAKENVRTHVDPRRWICVGVDDDKVVVDSIGGLMILILDNENGEALHQSFLALAGSAE